MVDFFAAEPFQHPAPKCKLHQTYLRKTPGFEVLQLLTRKTLCTIAPSCSSPLKVLSQNGSSLGLAKNSLATFVPFVCLFKFEPTVQARPTKGTKTSFYKYLTRKGQHLLSVSLSLSLCAVGLLIFFLYITWASMRRLTVRSHAKISSATDVFRSSSET